MPRRDATTPHPAVSSVAARAQSEHDGASRRLRDLGVEASSLAGLADALRVTSRLTLNFHPDRLDSRGSTVAAGLLNDGRYRSQFETGISNGGRTAVPGGDRTRWESGLFGGVYDAEQRVRPVYGALDVFRDPYGGAPRFGSSFVVLETHCLARATLCVGDSHVGPTDNGTADHLTSILAGALEECLTGDGFGRGLFINTFVDALHNGLPQTQSARELDRYIEAQVHGGLDLATDVESIVLDPSFGGSHIESDIRAAAARFGFEVEWSEGSEVIPDSIDPDFRGSDMLPLARVVAGDSGLVDAAAIGRVLADLPFTPPPPGGDAEESARQRYKKLWHCCLKFGTRPEPGPRSGQAGET